MSEKVPITTTNITNDVLVEAYGRIGQIVHAATKGLSEHRLAERPGPDGQGNSVAWLVWHLSRVQDDHLATLRQAEQIWTAKRWHTTFELPFDDTATGYGHSSEEVAMVQVSAELLTGYYDDVQAASIAYLKQLTPQDYARIVDPAWDPPVSLLVRLVSVLSDDLQHAGQAMYVRGLVAS